MAAAPNKVAQPLNKQDQNSNKSEAQQIDDDTGQGKTQNDIVQRPAAT